VLKGIKLVWNTNPASLNQPRKPLQLSEPKHHNMKTPELSIMRQTFKELREARNLKREYIAQKCGVGYDAIAKMEQGNADVGLTKLATYLKVMGVELDEFVKEYESNLHLAKGNFN
jgi:DNA-binding XRE family transcriptional regulator